MDLSLNVEIFCILEYSVLIIMYASSKLQINYRTHTRIAKSISICA